MIRLKTIVNVSERGYLTQNGEFIKFLLPGKHKLKKRRGQKCEMLNLSKRLRLAHQPQLDTMLQVYYAERELNKLATAVEFNKLMQNPEFSKHVIRFSASDNQIGVLFLDGRIFDSFSADDVFYLKDIGNIECKLFDLDELKITGLTNAQINCLPEGWVQAIVIDPGKVGVLSVDGEFVELLQPGIHDYWHAPQSRTIMVDKIDMRAQMIDVRGQEILTADNVAVRVNLTATYKIVDPISISAKLKNYADQLYTQMQLAFRKYLGQLTFEALISKTQEHANELLTIVKDATKDMYVEFDSAGIVDVILPGDITKIMNTVLVAKKTAEANVIARREETAATRSLLNTAKLLDENATLFRLKEMEHVEKISQNVGSISVGGDYLGKELRKLTIK